MFDYTFLLITMIIVCPQQTGAKLPSYVHLHTPAEVAETSYVVLNKINVCEDPQYSNAQLLIAIKSAPGNFGQRQIVRQTWLLEVVGRYIPHVFILGSTDDENLLDSLLAEDKENQDLLIGRFVDGYYNLTLKSMFILGWTKTNCPDRWLFYVDDDVLINVQNVIDFIGSANATSRHALFCHKGRPLVHREPDSKWFVPRSIWRSENFPRFCYGWAYLVPSEVVPLLHKAAVDNFTTPKLWLEDVFMTGIVTAAAGIQVVHTPFECCGRRDPALFQTNLALGEMGKAEELRKSWEIVHGNSSVRVAASRKRLGSKNRLLVFDQNGCLLEKSLRNKQELLDCMKGKSRSSFTNQSQLCYSILVLLIVVSVYIIRSRQVLFRLIAKLCSRR